MKRRIERSRARCHRAARALRRPRQAGVRDDVSLKAEPDACDAFGAKAQSAKRVRRGADAFARA
jgi:hypothetical protein